MMDKEIICINCPLGCRLTVAVEEGKVVNISGNTCGKGLEYAKTECLHPTRIMTTTVTIKNAMYSLLSVRTAKPIPKSLVKECVRCLRGVEVEAPVTAGEVIIENILGTGVDIIATKDLDALQT